jgi:hypothetical protein
MRRSSTLLVVLLLSACGETDPNTRESPGEKTEWSVLQSAEFNGRSTLETSPGLRSIQGYELLVVPGNDRKNVWIMLNPKSPPYYKQLPTGQFILPKGFVEQLVQQGKLGYTVEHVLASAAGRQ